jgi:hypothetical protein
MASPKQRKAQSYCLVVSLSLAFFARDVAAQVSGTATPVQRPLPPCPGSAILSWTGCVGTYTLPDGTKYVSEWKDGKPVGEGTLTFPDGGKYIGEAKDGRLFNGRCTQMMPNGAKYIGEWKDDMQAPNTVPTGQSCDQAFGKTGFLSEMGKQLRRAHKDMQSFARSFAKFLFCAVTLSIVSDNTLNRTWRTAAWNFLTRSILYCS